MSTYVSYGFLAQFANDPTVYELPSLATIEKLRTFAAKMYEDEIALYAKREYYIFEGIFLFHI